MPRYAGYTERTSKPEKSQTYKSFGKFATAALTVVIMLSLGLTSLKNGSIYGVRIIPTNLSLEREAFSASVAGAWDAVGRVFTDILSKELIYKRGK